MASIGENIANIRRRIADAARRSKRDAAEITLIAVSKTFSTVAVRDAWAAGQRDFGENKVQEGLTKIADTSDIEIRWHLIGHLQSNKARKAAAAFSCIHSVDSLDLLERLDTAAVDRPRAPLEVLIQVDLAAEATKFGAPPAEAERLVDAGLRARGVRLVGLMLLPPWNEDQEQSRPWFVRLRAFRDHLLGAGVPPHALRHLSMGMSHDFEAAIEEGSTMVRIGTAIFGQRQVRH